ncbi:MAG: efflux RND transporter periplasmic adaptor subunit [Nitrospirae bacterium]|nr:efflux RND transporter periplasmic adaptor subunit [Nitrospirota bacterium]
MKKRSFFITLIIVAVAIFIGIYYLSRQSPPPNLQAPSPVTQETEEPPAVEISPEKQQLIGVKTDVVKAIPLKKTIRTVGRIEYDERKIFTVNTKIEGWIEQLHIDYTGRYVKKGEPLAEIYSPELIATQQELITAIEWAKDAKAKAGNMLLRDAETLIDAVRQRLRLWDISDEQIRRIEETGKPIRTLTIYSPVSGYVVEKMVIQGMKVIPGEKLFNVADLSTIWIMADIYEYDMPFITVRQMAKIALSYFPGREFMSRIDYIYPALSGETRTAKVRFELLNPGGQLKPQMFTNVEIKIDMGRRLAIPEDAIIDTGTRQVVYVDKGDGYFEPREVMLGVRAEGLREVIMGLKAGERVASSATFLIDSEAQMKGVKPIGGINTKNSQ